MIKLNIDIILDYIKNNNLTKKEFCKLCDISLGALYKMIRNKDDFDCRFPTIVKVANVLKCSLNDIVYHWFLLGVFLS